MTMFFIYYRCSIFFICAMKKKNAKNLMNICAKPSEFLILVLHHKFIVRCCLEKKNARYSILSSKFRRKICFEQKRCNEKNVCTRVITIYDNWDFIDVIAFFNSVVICLFAFLKLAAGSYSLTTLKNYFTSFILIFVCVCFFSTRARECHWKENILMR